MLIDMHAHVIPDELAAQHGDGGDPCGPRIGPGEDPSTRLLVIGAMRFVASEVFYLAERRLEAMDKAGVDMEVISPMPPLLDYTIPPPAGLGLARRVNEFTAGLCETEPGRLVGLGMVPLQDPDAATAELKSLAEMGLRGFEVGSNANGVSLSDPRYVPMFKEAERLGLCVFVHAVNPTFREALPPSAVGSFGFAAEVAVAASGLIASGLAEACPELRLAFSHAAGGLALMLTRAEYFWRRTWNEEEPASPPEGTSPSASARKFYYDTLVFDRRALRYLIDMLGAGQLLIGTDFPAMPREQPAGASLSSMDLETEVVEDISWNNCFRYLAMVPPAKAGASGARERLSSSGTNVEQQGR